MHPLFLPRLVNGPFADPGLFIPFQFERRALLFDLGDNTPLAPRELLKVTHAFVTHTHMDHFIGFDRLLRLHLGREKDIFLYGPAGFLGHIEGKLAGYSWDLVGGYSGRLRLHATEVRADRLLSRSYESHRGFLPGAPAVERPFDGQLHAEPGFSVSAVALAHSIPGLGFRLEEKFHVNILGTELEAIGLAPGPWLTRFKQALYAGADPGLEFEVAPAAGRPPRRWTVGELQERIARISPGQRIAYITDVGDTPGNREAIVSFARNADLLFIEAAFRNDDRELAAAKHHLTARQAGEIAALAGACRFRIFHFSPRYEGRAELLHNEAQEAFEGQANRLKAEG
jgi:ribonuclease Z